MKNLNEQKMHSNIKRGIKMRVTPEQSRKVQEICFENGVQWVKGKTLRHLDKPFLFIDDYVYICYGTTFQEVYYSEEKNEEVSAELFIRTNGTCVESETPTEEFDQMLEQKSLKRYMVFVEGKNTPRYIHDSYDSAETEAKRLSTKLVGSKVFVVSVVKEFKSKVIVEEL